MAGESGLCWKQEVHSLTHHIPGLSSLWPYLWLPPSLLTILGRRGKDEECVLSGSTALSYDLLPAHHRVKVECVSSSL